MATKDKEKDKPRGFSQTAGTDSARAAQGNSDPDKRGEAHDRMSGNTVPNTGMGGTYDGDIQEMEQSGSPSHFVPDKSMDTGRPGNPRQGASVQEGEGAGTSYDYQANPQIAGQGQRDPDMDTGNHARDVERDMTSQSERNLTTNPDQGAPEQGANAHGTGRPGMNSQDPERETAGIP